MQDDGMASGAPYDALDTDPDPLETPSEAAAFFGPDEMPASTAAFFPTADAPSPCSASATDPPVPSGPSGSQWPNPPQHHAAMTAAPPQQHQPSMAGLHWQQQQHDVPSQGPSTAAAMLPQEPSPRPRRRAIAQPIRLDASTPVLCYRYAQGRAPTGDGRWQGRHAHLHYYLPEHWSSSYRWSVFEDSFVLSFSPAAAATPSELTAQAQTLPPPPPVRATFHLARPLHEGMGGTQEFELVWPQELDPALLEEIEAACERAVPIGAKRKPPSVSMQGVHLKLQKLDLL